MTAIQIINRIRISSNFEKHPRKKGKWTFVSNKTDSEFILISTMWAKHKQSEIEMVKRNSTSASSNNCLHWWERNLLPEIKNDCYSNHLKTSHKLQIRTASSKNRKMNFCLEIKLTVHSSWFWVAMWAKHKQSEIQMVKRNSTRTRSNNCLHWWGEKFASWNKKKLL